MDMAQALAAYRDVGYRYMLMPDHVPQIDGRGPSGVGFAYCYGYIRALLDALGPRLAVERPDRVASAEAGSQLRTISIARCKVSPQRSDLMSWRGDLYNPSAQEPHY